jgi:hypothetical protein
VQEALSQVVCFSVPQVHFAPSWQPHVHSEPHAFTVAFLPPQQSDFFSDSQVQSAPSWHPQVHSEPQATFSLVFSLDLPHSQPAPQVQSAPQVQEALSQAVCFSVPLEFSSLLLVLILDSFSLIIVSNYLIAHSLTHSLTTTTT